MSTTALLAAISLFADISFKALRLAWAKIEPMVDDLMRKDIPGETKKETVISAVAELFPADKQKVVRYGVTLLCNWALLLIHRRNAAAEKKALKGKLPSQVAASLVIAGALLCSSCAFFSKPSDDRVVFDSLVALTKRKAIPAETADSLWTEWQKAHADVAAAPSPSPSKADAKP